MRCAILYGGKRFTRNLRLYAGAIVVTASVVVPGRALHPVVPQFAVAALPERPKSLRFQDRRPEAAATEFKLSHYPAPGALDSAFHQPYISIDEAVEPSPPTSYEECGSLGPACCRVRSDLHAGVRLRPGCGLGRLLSPARRRPASVHEWQLHALRTEWTIPHALLLAGGGQD